MNQKKCIVAPSILAADFSKLGQEVKRVYDAGCRRLHIDVMDGVFVPNISIGPVVIQSIRNIVPDMFFDVHLMITDPMKYIHTFAQAGADGITIHLEANTDADQCIAQIKKLNKKAGISIRPDTPAEYADRFLTQIDTILVMTVNPGFGGQAFMESCLSRIAYFREKLDLLGLRDVDLEVDGGINETTAALSRKAGANILVSGTWIFESKNIKKSIEKLLL